MFTYPCNGEKYYLRTITVAAIVVEFVASVAATRVSALVVGTDMTAAGLTVLAFVFI